MNTTNNQQQTTAGKRLLASLLLAVGSHCWELEAGISHAVVKKKSGLIGHRVGKWQFLDPSF
jgi:hypothetical protein